VHRRIAIAIVLYLAAGMAFLVSVNADQQDFAVPFFVIAALAVMVGWVTGEAGLGYLWIGLVLPWILIPLGLPFGDTNKFTGGDGVTPVALMAVAPAFASVVLIPLAAGVRILYDRRRGGYAA
jgi:uncharacterized membrane protein